MIILILLAFLVGIPIAYLITLAYQLFTGKKRSALLSLLTATAAAASAAWATSQARGSWTDLGYFLVPLQAVVAGFLVLAFRRWENEPTPARRTLARIALAFSLLIIAYNVARGMQRTSYNRATETHG